MAWCCHHTRFFFFFDISVTSRWHEDVECEGDIHSCCGGQVDLCTTTRSEQLWWPSLLGLETIRPMLGAWPGRELATYACPCIVFILFHNFNDIVDESREQEIQKFCMTGLLNFRR